MDDDVSVCFELEPKVFTARKSAWFDYNGGPFLKQNSNLISFVQPTKKCASFVRKLTFSPTYFGSCENCLFPLRSKGPVFSGCFLGSKKCPTLTVTFFLQTTDLTLKGPLLQNTKTTFNITYIF